MTHTEAELAYFAGIMDADGCFNINRTGALPRCDYNIRIQVMNTSKDLTDWLQGQFGGHVYERASKHGWKTRFEWFLGRQAIPDIVAAIRPYLVIKHRQADLALSFRKSFERRHHPLPQKIRVFREDCYLQMKALNAKGQQ